MTHDAQAVVRLVAAAQALRDAREAQMITKVEWEGLAAAVAALGCATGSGSAVVMGINSAGRDSRGINTVPL